MSGRRGRAARLALRSPGEVGHPWNERQAQLAAGLQARQLAKARHRSHKLLRSKFTNAEWERAADQASAERRAQVGNSRYTPPRVRSQT